MELLEWFWSIFGPLFCDYLENCRSVKTNDPPSFLMFFFVFGARLGGFGSSFGECLGAVLGDFRQDGEQERQDGDQDRQAEATYAHMRESSRIWGSRTGGKPGAESLVTVLA